MDYITLNGKRYPVSDFRLVAKPQSNADRNMRILSTNRTNSASSGEKRTNADRIRSMTDEELAHLLHSTEEHLFTGNLWNYEKWTEWLKQETKGEE